MVMVEAAAAPFRPKVLPAPRWSHWTTVKYFSQFRKPAYPQGLVASPGPLCKSSQHWVLAVLAANRNPLLESTDLYIIGFVDSVRIGNRIVPRAAGTQECQGGRQFLEFAAF